MGESATPRARSASPRLASPRTAVDWPRGGVAVLILLATSRLA